MNMNESPAMIVTLDGPAGAGKSTVARRLAERLGVDFLDTGAMYRGVAAAALDRGLDTAEAETVGALARSLDIRFDWTTAPPTLYVDDAPMVDRLRDADVTQAVSDVASSPSVRAVLVDRQQQIGREHPRLVTEGRDQGSVVFPDAVAKFYLEASPEVRARRRANQLREAGRDADEAAILQAIVDRDARDATRPDGPLTCPEGADRIDSSRMTLDEVVDLLTARVQRVVMSDGGPG